MIRSIYFSPEGTLETNLDPSEFSTRMQAKNGLLWVDMASSEPEQDAPIMEQIFKFHPLAIEDALQQSHLPKIDDWEDYLYIVLHAIQYNKNSDDPIHTLELDIFIGSNYLLTHHDEPIGSIERAWELCHRDDRPARNGVDYLLYRICDEIVGSYMPVVEDLDEAIDVAEDEIFGDPGPETLERIFNLKRSTLKMRRILGPQREVFNRLARDEYRLIDRKARIYFRDIYDQLVRMHEIVEGIRDLVGGTLDSYLSVINNRMNEIMKTLTLITTLFMPISFLASFFGMNFFQPVSPLQIWTGMPAFILTMVLIVLTPLGMYLWMRRRKWM